MVANSSPVSSSQRAGSTDHASKLIDAKVELPPATSAGEPPCFAAAHSLMRPTYGQTRSCRDTRWMLSPGGDRSQTAPSDADCRRESGRIVGGGEVDRLRHHPEQRVQEPSRPGVAGRCASRSRGHQGGLDGEIRVAPLPTPPMPLYMAGRPGMRSLPRITTPSHRRGERRA